MIKWDKYFFFVPNFFSEFIERIDSPCTGRIMCHNKIYIGNNKFIDGILEACTTVGAEIRYTSTPKMSSAEIIRKTMGDHVD